MEKEKEEKQKEEEEMEGGADVSKDRGRAITGGE